MHEALIKEYGGVMRKSTLFAGLDDARLAEALACFGAEKIVRSKGETVHEPMRRFSFFGLVLSGGVLVCRDDIRGCRMIMADVGPGRTFGESLCFLGTADAPVYIIARERTVILRMSAENVRSGGVFAERFTSLLARRTLDMNERIQVLSAGSIRAKVLTYLGTIAGVPAEGAVTVTVPLGRTDMAAYLGTDRSALSRELGRMQAEGLIAINGREFTVYR